MLNTPAGSHQLVSGGAPFNSTDSHAPGDLGGEGAVSGTIWTHDRLGDAGLALLPNACAASASSAAAKSIATVTTRRCCWEAA